MSQEISWSMGLTGTKGGLGPVSLSGSGTADMSGSNFGGQVQSMSTSPVALNLSGAVSIQCVAIKNLPYAADGTTANTATVTIGLNTPITQVVSVIPPGKMIMLWGIAATLYGIASAGTPDIAIEVFEP